MYVYTYIYIYIYIFAYVYIQVTLVPSLVVQFTYVGCLNGCLCGWLVHNDPVVIPFNGGQDGVSKPRHTEEGRPNVWASTPELTHHTLA